MACGGRSLASPPSPVWLSSLARTPTGHPVCFAELVVLACPGLCLVCPRCPEECLAPARHLINLCRMNELERLQCPLAEPGPRTTSFTRRAVRGGMGPMAMKLARLTWALPQCFAPQGQGWTAGLPSHMEPVRPWRAGATPAVPISLCPPSEPGTDP